MEIVPLRMSLMKFSSIQPFSHPARVGQSLGDMLVRNHTRALTTHTE